MARFRNVFSIFLITFLLSITLPYIAYSQDTAISQELSALESYIEQIPPFEFRDNIQGKTAVLEGIKKAASLAEDNMLRGAKDLLTRLLVRLNTNIVVIQPVSRDNLIRRLSGLLKKILS